MEFNPDGSLKIEKAIHAQNTNLKKFDYLEILKLVDEIPFNVGRNLLLALLQGDESNVSVKKNQLFLLGQFGCLGGYEGDEIQIMLDELVRKDLLNYQKNDPRYGMVFSLSEKGRKHMISPVESVLDKGTNSSALIISDDQRKVFDSFDFFLKNFNDHQKLAVTSSKEKLLCIAGAGSGKTTVLTKRIEFLIRFKGVADKELLAITFTKKARQDMLNRLSTSILGNKVQVETFNSFCEKFLRKYNDKQYDKEFRVISYKEKIHFVIAALEKLNMKMEEALEMYFSARQFQDRENDELLRIFVNDCFFVFDLFNNQGVPFRDFTDDMTGLTEKEKQSAKLTYQVCSVVRHMMKTQGLRDFSDQIAHALEIMKNHPDLVPKFSHVLVDEYQDINAIQSVLIDTLDSKNLFCVGDPRQCIFGWRGSQIKYILNFTSKYPDAEIIYLTDNYRSGRKIVQLINASIRSMALPDLVHQNKFDGNCIAIAHPAEQDEFAFVLASLQSLSVDPSEVFVLARTNKQLRELSKLLLTQKIPHLIKTEEFTEGTSGITLATIHAIKGLEAKVVYLIGAHSNNFPCRASDHPVHSLVKHEEYDSEEEERRLFYVALSRAKEHVIISYTGSLTRFFTDSMQHFVEKIGESKPSSDDIVSRLRRYRFDAAKSLNLPPYHIFNDKTMIDLATQLPLSLSELEDIYGLGPNKIERFGQDILDVLQGKR